MGSKEMLHQIAIWNHWLEDIKDEVIGLLTSRYIFQEVQQIIRQNPNIQKPSSFYEWMPIVYASHAVMGVRRLLDKRSDSISLARLLDEIQKNPYILTREWFLSLFDLTRYPTLEQPFVKELNDEAFDEFAGAGKSHVDPAKIASDLLCLRQKANNLHQYATKRIAHSDERALTQLPTFHELNECLDYLGDLVKKYLRLLRGHGYTQLLPVWQYDWKAIFREPWIPSTPRRNVPRSPS